MNNHIHYDIAFKKITKIVELEERLKIRPELTINRAYISGLPKQQVTEYLNIDEALEIDDEPVLEEE